MIRNSRSGLPARVIALALLMVAAAPAAAQSQAAEEQAPIMRFAAPSDDQPGFDDPAAAVEALRSILAADKFDDLARLLGLDAAKLREAEGVMDTYAGMRAGAARLIVMSDSSDGKVLAIGDRLWPLPFPLARDPNGQWRFATAVGLEEIVNRRIGENELEVIGTMRAYVDAQYLYASEDRDGDGVLEFAQKLLSSEGRTDGLYWPAEQGTGDSPAGGLISDAALDKAQEGDGYFGYRFRILSGQGENIAGGAHDYIINGNMIAGFALLAWPARYAETGVHTFLVNQHGIVYEADLGASTESIVKYIDRFNPDGDWRVATD